MMQGHVWNSVIAAVMVVMTTVRQKVSVCSSQCSHPLVDRHYKCSSLISLRARFLGSARRVCLHSVLLGHPVQQPELCRGGAEAPGAALPSAESQRGRDRGEDRQAGKEEGVNSLSITLFYSNPSSPFPPPPFFFPPPRPARSARRSGLWFPLPLVRTRAARHRAGHGAPGRPGRDGQQKAVRDERKGDQTGGVNEQAGRRRAN